MAAALTQSRAGTIDWDGDNGVGNFTFDNNWFGDNNPNNFGGWVSSNNLQFQFNNGNATSLFYNYGGYRDIGDIKFLSTFNTGAGPLNNNGLGSITWNGDGNGLNFNQRLENSSTSTLVIGSMNFSGAKFGAGQIELNPINGDIIFNSTSSIFNDNAKPYMVFGGGGHTLKLSNVLGVGGNAAAVSLTDQSNNIVVIDASQIYTGDTTVNAGRIELTQNGGVAGAIKIGNTSGSATAELRLTDADGGFSENANITVNPTGTGTRTISSTNTSGTNTLTGTLTLSTGVTVNVSDASGTLALTNTVSSTGGLTKTGPGTLTLSGTNSYSGVTTISGGILSANTLANGLSNSSIGASSNVAGNLVIDGGTLQYTGAATSSDRLFTIGTSGATLDASGSGAINFNNGGTILRTPTSGSRTLTLTGTNTGANTLGDLLSDPSTGTLSVIKNGAGQWVLNKNNTFTGGLTINQGVLRGESSGGAFGTGAITLAGGELQTAVGNTNFGNNTVVSGNAQITSDRVGTGAAFTATFGTLSIGAQTLTIAKGSNVTSGTAGVTFGATTLAGNATFNVGSGALLTLGNISGGTNTLLLNSGAGSLTLAGTVSNTIGLLTATTGSLNLSKTSGNAIGANGLTVNGATATETASNQIDDIATLSVSSGSFGIGTFSDTIGNLNVTGGSVTATSGVLTIASTGTTSISNPTTFSANLVTGTSGLSLTSGTLSGALTLNGNLTVSATGAGSILSGGITVNAAESWTNNNATTLGVSSAVTYNNQLTLNSGSFTFNAAGTGAGGVKLATGSTAVNASTGAIFGTGTLEFNGGTYRNSTAGTDRSLSNLFSITGDSIFDAAGSGGSNTFTGGGTTTGNRTLTINTSTTSFNTGTLTLGGNLTLQGTGTAAFGGALSVGGGNRILATSLGNALTISGGITGTGNMTLDANSSAAINVTTAAVNNSGTLTNAGTGAGTTTISGGVGSNVTGITENSTTSALTISTNAINANSSGTTLTNSSGTKLLTVASGVVGTGNLVLNNNSSTDGGITLSGTSINNVGGITNSGSGSGNTNITAVIGSNVTGVTENGSSALFLSAQNTYSGATNLTGGSIILGSSSTVSSGALVSGAVGTGVLHLGSGSNSATLTTDIAGTRTIQNSISLDGDMAFAVGSGQASGRIALDVATGLTTPNTFVLTRTNQLTVNSNEVVDFIGALSGSGFGFTKLGAGTLNLGVISGGVGADTSINTFSGPVTISAGTVNLRKASGVNAIAGDGNPATTDITINGGTLHWDQNEQLDNTATIVISSGTADLGGKTETLGTLINNGGTFQTGSGHLIGTTASIQWNGGTNTINAGGIIEDGHITITGGTNIVNGGSTEGLLHLLSGGIGLQMTGATLTLNSDNSNPGRLWLEGDVSTAASSTTSTIANGLSNTKTGVVDLGAGSRTFTVADGAATTDLLVTAKITNGSLVKAGAGNMQLSGPNTYTGSTTINGGTLTADVGTLVSSSGVTVNSGGTLLLNGNGRHLGANAPVVLNGGTFNTGGFSEPGAGAGSAAANAIGALTLTLNSTIDFGAGSTSILEFAGLGAHTAITGADLAVINWDRTIGPNPVGSGDGLYFIGTSTDFVTKFDQSDVSFNGITGYAVFDYVGYYEVVGLTAVPEPSTWVAGSLALLALAYSQRRRLSILRKR